MKKEAGFSLIELVVAMAVLALIMGAMVHLFGGSVVSLHTGSKQEVVYEEARLVMNELKTTLRYAERDSIEPEKPTAATETFFYKGDMFDRHMAISEGKNKAYEITVKWKDDTKKQLEITRKNITDGDTKVTVFPQDIKNSAFTYDDKFNGEFPIVAETVTLNNGDNVVLYQITLPVQYVLNGKPQLQTLTTKVVPSRDEEEDNSIEGQLIRAYKEILELGMKISDNKLKPNKNDLTANEWKLYNDFMDKIYGEGNRNNSSLTSNDVIRKYLVNEKYGGTWPVKNINGVDLYIQPYCHLYNVAPTTSNIFIYGSKNVKDTSTNNWNVNYIYDMDAKSWYTGEKIMIANKSWATVKGEMQSKGWIKVK